MITQETKVRIIVNSSRLESSSQGTLDFPCAGYFTTGLETGSVEIPWHYHPEFECIAVLQGEKEVHLPGAVYHIHPGECLFINSGVLHYTQTKPNSIFRSIVFSPSLIYGGETSVFRKKYIDPLTRLCLKGYLLSGRHSWEQHFQKSFIAAFNALKKESFGYEFQVRELLSECCSTLYHELSGQYESRIKKESADEIRLRQMLDYIRLHYSEHLELSDIAASASIGVRESLRCFKSTIGTSPMQYLKKYRISQGADLLLMSRTDTVATIAGMCGFESPSYFSSVFRRFYHQTPEEYRRQPLS